jgi:hypothetical protein
VLPMAENGSGRSPIGWDDLKLTFVIKSFVDYLSGSNGGFNTSFSSLNP